MLNRRALLQGLVGGGVAGAALPAISCERDAIGSAPDWHLDISQARALMASGNDGPCNVVLRTSTHVVDDGSRLARCLWTLKRSIDMSLAVFLNGRFLSPFNVDGNLFGLLLSGPMKPLHWTKRKRVRDNGELYGHVIYIASGPVVDGKWKEWYRVGSYWETWENFDVQRKKFDSANEILKRIGFEEDEPLRIKTFNGRFRTTPLGPGVEIL